MLAQLCEATWQSHHNRNTLAFLPSSSSSRNPIFQTGLREGSKTRERRRPLRSMGYIEEREASSSRRLAEHIDAELPSLFPGTVPA